MHRRDFLTLAGTGALGTAWTLPAHAGPAPGAGSDDTRDDRFEVICERLEREMANQRVTGVALGILKQGELSMRGFGLTNLDNPQPVTPDTVFPLASISKTVVTVAILRLVEQGRLELDDPVQRHLPEFRVLDADVSRTVTVRHLLTHMGGWNGDARADDDAHLVRSIADRPQNAAPGEVWGYNNIGFSVAGRIIEVLTDSPIHEAMRDLVFDPLELEHAFTRGSMATTYRFAWPHSMVDGRSAVVRPFQLYPLSSGNMAMSLSSLMEYSRFLLGDGRARSGARVLSTASLALMRTPQLVKRPTTEEMGIGFHLRRLGGVTTAAHCGTGAGMAGRHFQLVPERNLAFAILTNHQAGWRVHSVVERLILDTYEGLRLEPNQRIGADRGGFEDMTHHAEPLAQQPSPEDYVGTFDLNFTPIPSWGMTVGSEGGRLMAHGELFEVQFSVPLVFWAPDQAYADWDAHGEPETYPYRGAPIEFVRDQEGDVRWVRFAGRIARRIG